MALAFDAASGAKNDNASSLTFAHTCSGADRLLVVTAGSVDFPPGPAITGITYNGDALTRLWTVNYNEADTLQIYSECWYLVAPDTGAHDIIVTWAASAEICASAVSFTGADQSSPFGTPVTGQAASSTPSVTVSSATGEIVIDGIRAGQPTIAVGAGQTSRNEQETINFSSSGGSSTEAGASSVTMSWTFGAGGYGDKWAMGGVSVKAAAGAQTVSPSGVAVAVTMGGPTVTRGAVTVSPSGIAVGVTFGSPTVTLEAGGAQDVSPSGIVVPVSFGTPTVSRVGEFRGEANRYRPPTIRRNAVAHTPTFSAHASVANGTTATGTQSSYLTVFRLRLSASVSEGTRASGTDELSEEDFAALLKVI